MALMIPWDAVLAPGPKAAAEKLVKLAAELGWTVEIERVERGQEGDEPHA
jgi:hypothetical protein